MNSFEYTFASPRSQQFLIPSNIIYYITKNPFASSKGFEKLQKTCKYFFSKNPVLIGYNWVVFLIQDPEILERPDVKCLWNAPYKIWINDEVYIKNLNIHIFFQKLYRLDAKKICIREGELIFNEFLLLSSSPYAYEVWFEDMNIKYSDGTMVPLEKILNNFPKVII